MDAGQNIQSLGLPSLQTGTYKILLIFPIQMCFLKGALLNKFIDHTANLCNKTVSFGFPALSHLLVFNSPSSKSRFVLDKCIPRASSKSWPVFLY